MRRLTRWAGLLAAVSISLGVPHLADADTLRYTVIAENVTGIVLGTLVPNCANNPCVITMTGVGDTTAVTGFQALAGTSTVIGAGAITGALTNLTVTVYDPITGLTHGPATLPSGYFAGYDSINGGVGFGSNAPAGPAYPLSVFFYRYPPGPLELPSIYSLTTPALAGGSMLNCPVGCGPTPIKTIPVTLPDGSTVPFSVPSTGALQAQFWAQPEPPTFQWSAAASMVRARSGHTATLMSDGRVLVVGGKESSASTTAEIYDPVAGTWTATASPSCARTGHVATLLADGRVLVVGGAQCPTSAEAYDPVAVAWTTVAAIPIPFNSSGTQIVRLPDGRVLVLTAAGGEIWDPVANAWTAPAGMPALTGPLAVLLSNGTVFVADCGASQIFNPTANSWTAAPGSPGCSTSNLMATALPSGNVLLNGGSEWAVYYSASNTWIGLNDSLATSDQYTLPLGTTSVPTLLGDGRVLLVGGNEMPVTPTTGDPNPIQLPAPVSPVFDPPAISWAVMPALSVGRTGHAVVTLQNGHVLAIGGRAIAAGSGSLSSVEELAQGATSQTITNFTVPAVLLNGASGTLSATSTSGLPVTFESMSPVSCTVSGTTVTAVGGGAGGDCFVSANQAGNSTYAPAPSINSYFPVKPTAPVFSLAGGTYHTPQTLVLTDATPNVFIYYTYTANGAIPNNTSTLYTGPISIESSGIVEAVAQPEFGIGGYSAISSKAYVYSSESPATPAFSPRTGTYSTAQTVTISDATPGATIYYTTNGTVPTTSSTKYTAPIKVAATETVQAIAVEAGYSNSTVATAKYTLVVATPAFSPRTGTYSTAQTVTISDATPGATIYYTTNGTVPTTSSTKFRRG